MECPNGGQHETYQYTHVNGETHRTITVCHKCNQEWEG